jgi:hypothetical protein
MLAYILALAVGIGSLAIYLAAFFFPEIHRKNDFIWSGIGLFYALVLWVFSPRITGGLLLGHIASVALLWWFGWQTLTLRRQVTPQVQQTPVPSTEAVQTSIQEQVNKLSLPERLSQLQQGISSTFSGVKDKVQQISTPKTPTTPKPEDITSVIKEEAPAVEIIDKTTATPEAPTEEAVATIDTEAKTESVPEAVAPNPPSPELVEAAQADGEGEKPPIPVEEVAPDAVLAPPAETPPEGTPPNN